MRSVTHYRIGEKLDKMKVRHTLGDLGGAIGRLNQDIAALRTKSGSDSFSKSVNTPKELSTGLDTELEVLQSKYDVSEPLVGWEASGAAEAVK